MEHTASLPLTLPKAKKGAQASPASCCDAQDASRCEGKGTCALDGATGEGCRRKCRGGSKKAGGEHEDGTMCNDGSLATRWTPSGSWFSDYLHFCGPGWFVAIACESTGHSLAHVGAILVYSKHRAPLTLQKTHVQT